MYFVHNKNVIRTLFYTTAKLYSFQNKWQSLFYNHPKHNLSQIQRDVKLIRMIGRTYKNSRTRVVSMKDEYISKEQVKQHRDWQLGTYLTLNFSICNLGFYGMTYFSVWSKKCVLLYLRYNQIHPIFKVYVPLLLLEDLMLSNMFLHISYKNFCSCHFITTV